MLCFNVRRIANYIGKSFILIENICKSHFYIKRLDFYDELCGNMIIGTYQSVPKFYITVYFTEYLLTKSANTAPSLRIVAVNDFKG